MSASDAVRVATAVSPSITVKLVEPVTPGAAPGPGIVSSSRCDSFRPSPVQIAPVSVQLRSAGRTIATSLFSLGSIVISQRVLLGGSSRRAFVTAPPA